MDYYSVRGPNVVPSLWDTLLEQSSSLQLLSFKSLWDKTHAWALCSDLYSWAWFRHCMLLLLLLLLLLLFYALTPPPFIFACSSWCGPPIHQSPCSGTGSIPQPSKPLRGPPTNMAFWPQAVERLTKPFGSGTLTPARPSSRLTPTPRCATWPGQRAQMNLWAPTAIPRTILVSGGILRSRK